MPYFELAKKENITNQEKFVSMLYDLEILKTEDTEEEKIFFTKMFHDMLSLFSLPLQDETFDFSNDVFFSKIAQLAEKYSKNTQIRKYNANRGSKHFIYMNRTFFGLYNLMFELKANRVIINNFKTL
jgi:hypothetical protein